MIEHFILWLKTILPPMETMEWQWFKAHVGALGQNGVWDTTTTDAMGNVHGEKNLFGQINTKDNRRQFSLGVAYTLPMLVVLQTEIYHDGNLRVQLMREDIPISKRVRASFMVNTDKEYMAGLRYIVNKNIGLTTHYDSDMGLGLGIFLNY